MISSKSATNTTRFDFLTSLQLTKLKHTKSTLDNFRKFLGVGDPEKVAEKRNSGVEKFKVLSLTGFKKY